MLDDSSAKLVNVNIILGNYNDEYCWIPSGINSVPRAFKILIVQFFVGLLGWKAVVEECCNLSGARITEKSANAVF